VLGGNDHLARLAALATFERPLQPGHDLPMPVQIFERLAFRAVDDFALTILQGVIDGNDAVLGHDHERDGEVPAPRLQAITRAARPGLPNKWPRPVGWRRSWRAVPEPDGRAWRASAGARCWPAPTPAPAQPS